MTEITKNPHANDKMIEREKGTKQNTVFHSNLRSQNYWVNKRPHLMALNRYRADYSTIFLLKLFFFSVHPNIFGFNEKRFEIKKSKIPFEKNKKQLLNQLSRFSNKRQNKHIEPNKKLVPKCTKRANHMITTDV